MEPTSDLESDLNALMKEYGLISLLEALQELVNSRADSAEATATDSPDASSSEQIEAYRDVSRSLNTLIKTLPPELDYEMALEQVTHTSSDLGDSDEMLSFG